MTNTSQRNTPERFKQLLAGYIRQSLSSEELPEFFELVRSANYEHLLGEQVDIQFSGRLIKDVTNEEQAGAAFQALRSKIEIPAKRVISMPWRKAAAAAILLILGATAWLLLNRAPEKSLANNAPAKRQDIAAPAFSHASITLSNGQQIMLDSARNGTLALQGSVKLSKLDDGDISYTGSSEANVFNLLTNPRGSKVISLVLSDGTRVWLNAASSLRYPTSFSAGKERKVEITGEAYFEVAHDPSKPFIVHKGEINVQVLGTHFNVNSYAEEGDIKVTLMEGAVKVSTSMETGMLRPGQQAQVSRAIKIVDKVDLEEVMAWKNGKFFFAEANIDAVMNQVARWYDVDIVYEGTKPSVHFIGDISRMENVSEVLKMLEQTKAVRFRIEERKIMVSSP